MRDKSTRRTFLLAGTAVAAGVAGCTGNEGQGTGTETETGTSASTPTEAQGGGEAQEGGQSPTGTGEAGMQPGTEIRLGGEVGGWVGQAPTSIQGTTNPTLQLKAGATYTITWKNLDGTEHELIIEDDTGSAVVKTNSARQQGKTVSKQFTARANMTAYYCDYHPQSMRGSVSAGGKTGGGGTGTTTATGTGTGTQTGNGGY